MRLSQRLRAWPASLFRPGKMSLWAWSCFTAAPESNFICWMNGLPHFGVCICNGGYKTEVPKKLFSTLPEKEVIQPHLPVRLPCYDFTPVTSPALGISLLAVKPTTSGMASSHSVTGGVYKARERIHRRMADRRLLAIPASCRRVAACNPN